MLKPVLAAATLLLLAACSSPKSYPLAEAPAELKDGAARGTAAIGTLKKGLVTRLTAELGQHGPVSAIGVCKTEAPAITGKVAQEQSIQVGRTSHRLRNPANATPKWAEKTVTASAGKAFSEVGPQVFDLGEKVGVLEPLGVQPMCVTCHGPKEQLSPELTSAIAAAYPGDAATGFTEGQLRGWAWAEVPKTP